MNINQLLTELNENGISLSTEGDDLLLNFDGEQIPDLLLEKIKADKQELVSYIKKYAGQEDVEDIEVIEEQESYPLSYAQKRIWILSQYPEISKAYMIPHEIELSQNIDFERFKKSLRAVIQRHEVLRTVFKEDQNGEVKQWILDIDEFDLDIRSVDFSKEKDREECANKYIEEDGFQLFDLTKGPLLRASLIKISETSFRFYYIIHHIVSDGWSLGVLVNDFLNYYNGYESDENFSLDPLEIQYKDYSNWQKMQLSADRIKSHKEYWLNSFKGAIPAIEIPSEKTRPTIKSNNGAVLETYLSKKLTQKLNQYAKGNQGSVFTVLLSMWNVLLYKYTGQNEIVIGTAVAGRDHVYLENQIGFYINTLALKNKIDPEKTFAEFYQQLKENSLEAFAHQIYPFDLLVDELNLARDSSRHPIFDIMVTYQNAGMTNDDHTVVDDELIKFKCKRNAKFDIEINATEIGDYLHFTVNYNTDIYNEEMVRQLLNHFKTFTEIALTNPNRNIWEYELLSKAEKQKLLIDFNDTQIDFSSDKTIIELFETQVEKNPKAVAVVTDTKALTYNELNKKANQLGHYLRDNYKVKSDTLIGIELARNTDLIIAIYGVLKAGAAYVPIDIFNPEDRKDYIKSDADCACIIDENFLNQFKNKSEKYSDQNPEKINSPDSLVYVIYTSGSTGNPKGAMIENKALINRLEWMQKAYTLDNEDVILQKTTYSFDVSVWELLWWSLYGAKVFLLEPNGEKDPSKIVNAIEKASVTVMHFVPSMFTSFLSYIKEFPEEKEKLSTLKQIFTSGEALSKNHRDLSIEELPWVSLMNLYGPTEASIDVTYYDCSEERNDLLIPIGKPIDNIQMYVLDDYKRPVPLGVKGKLYIAGAGLARGYLNKGELTNEKFVSNPFSPGTRMYDTGDMAQWLKDGNINFLGRIDHQVKIRGFRIELGEIEYHLRDKETIDDAVVLVKETTPSQKDLIAFIVSNKEQDVLELKNYLLDKVPSYMVPPFYVQVDKFPLNASGKTDRRKLLNSAYAELTTNIEYVAPQTAQEKILVEVCMEILNKEKISVKENFYDLGGDSIKSIQMVSRLKQAGYAIKVEEILRTPVLEKLALLLTSDIRHVDQAEITGEILLTPVQQYLFDNFERPEHFNQAIVLKSTVPLELNILETCFSELLKHHDALRIQFTKDGKELRQYNLSLKEVVFTIHTFDFSESEDHLKEMNDLGGKLQSSFQLDQTPLLKVAHFKLPEGERLAIIVHHLVIDGISWRIFIEDLMTLYTQAKAQQNFKLPLKTDSFQQWSKLQKQYANSEKMNEEGRYWSQLCEQNTPRIKTDFDISEDVFLDNEVTFDLDEQTTHLLQSNFHKVYNTEINDVLLTGLGLAIKEIFDDEKVLVKMEGHGREQIIDDLDISRTIGWFTSIYPFLLDVGTNLSTTESLINVKEQLRKIPNKGVGFGMLKYLNEDYKNLSYKPSVIFNYLGDFDTSFDSDESELSYSIDAIGDNIAKENVENILLNVSGSITSNQLFMSIMFSDKAFSESKIHQLAAAYKKYLTSLIVNISGKQESYKTPSDLTFKGLSIEQLKRFNSETIEDIYELSPLQQGIYYHWLTTESKTLYFEQISYRLDAKHLKINELRSAFQNLIDRHGVLRTSFTNKLCDVPLQIVRKNVKADFSYDQVPNKIKQSTIENYISQYKLKDREEGFELINPSLMRLKILDLGKGKYEFVWSHHHILMDGWCMSILIQDFNTILNSISQNLTFDIPSPKPYSDYINWLKNINKDNSLKYWESYLDGYDQTATIPQKSNTSTKGIYSEATRSIQLKEKAFEKMKTVCKNLNVTQNTFLQTIWGIVLAKYNNVQDVVFGSVVSGRPASLEGVENIVGLFINTIPVRISYEEESLLEDLLKEVQKNAIDSNAHHYLNLARVQSHSELGADLINHIMVFENFPVQEVVKENINSQSSVETQNINVEAVEVFEQTNYDLNILIIPTDSTLRIEFQFNKNVYDESRVENLSGHLSNVIHYFLDNPKSKIKDTDFLTTEEQELIASFNASETDYAKNLTVLDLLTLRVQENGDDPAVSFGKRTLSYKELDEQSNQIAHCLIEEYDIEKNDLIGIQLDRSIEMIVGILGILKTGGAYVPLDMQYPKERVLYIQEDSKFKVCINDEFVTQFKAKKKSYSKASLDIKINGADLAYGIYTSGSTGNPKGVLNAHAGLYNRLLWMRDDLQITKDDIILQKTPYTFDVSVWELIMPSITGSHLVFAKPEGHKDPLYLQELIKESRASIMHFVPSMLAIFLENLNPDTCKSLRHIVCSGEALPASMVEKFKSKLPWVRIHNLYGPTEAAIDVTAIDLTDVNTKLEDVTIGKPVANTRIYIVDKNLNQQPIGVSGELLIEGIQVAQGYLNRPELNAEKFISSPFIKGERIYRTGDLAKWLPNGEIAYMGRMDHQVKIRGNRIELGEIETKIQSSGYTSNSVVIVKGTENRKYLVAYVIPKKDYSEDKLYDYLAVHLPEYMIPVNIMALEAFPLTSSGKINRKKLPDLGEGQPIALQTIAPRNEMEKSLVAIWEEVLQYKGIGVTDNFFRIGGDSILSIRLINKINNSFGVNLKITQLHESNTIEELCSLIDQGMTLFREEQRMKDEIELDIEALTKSVFAKIDNPLNIEDVYPMRDIQKGMVILSSINPTAGIYHDQFVFQVASIDKTIFKNAFSVLINKHASLRTYFDLTTFSREVQIVKKEINFTIDYRSIKDLEIAAQRKYLEEYMLAERKKPFKIDDGLLWRISLFELNDDSSIFLFQFHHAILDGWSIASLNTELFQIYKKLEQNIPLDIEMLKATNRAAVIEELYENKNQDTIDFWKLELEEYKKVNIFKSDLENQILTKTFDYNFKYNLENKCRKDGITLKTAIYGAFIYALNNISYEEDFVVGMVSNNRPIIDDGDKLLGCFLNTIPVRNRLEDIASLTWQDYFSFTEKNLLKIRKKDRITLYEISKIANEETNDGSPFFDVIFNYVDFHIYNTIDHETDSTIDMSTNDKVAFESFEATNTDFDLNVNISGSLLSLTYKLKRGLKNEVTLEKIHHYINSALQNYIDNATSKIADTEILSPKELKLLKTFNATETTYAKDTSVLDLLKSSVYNNEHSAAVIYEENTLTYKELDEQTNLLSNYLIEKFQVEKNDLVGVQLERSIDMLVAILGILKAGGAYIPIDMQYPKDRVQFIEKDSNFKVCIDQDFISNFKTKGTILNKTATRLKVDGSNLAYGIYTSGSTGNPKGVINNHAGLYNRLLWMRDSLEISSKDIILQKTPYTFDVSVWELLMPSITGCCLVFAKPDGHKDPSYLQQLIQDKKVSIIHFVPSMLGIFLENLHPEKCKNLRHVVCSGEALPSSMVEEFKRLLPWVRIHNLYGPTEAAIDVTAIDLTDVDTKKVGVSIGKPVANTKIHIVDKNLKRQAIGVPGELIIEGVQVAVGYLNRPDLNAKKFLPSPFTDASRIYRTGDLAKWLPNGEIAYLGRLDNQVKIRGNRIELGEIETKIQSSGLVENAAVLVKNNKNNRKYLVAYIIPKEDYSEDKLFNYLMTNLPEYMIPSLIISLEEFPLTTSGKINRKELIKLKVNAAKINENYVAPRNKMEEKMVAIWEEVLDYKGIGIFDDFFRIGGDSILSIRLISEVNKQFETSLTIAQLYETTTIDKLFEQIKLNTSTTKEKKKKKEQIKMSFDDLFEKVMND